MHARFLFLLAGLCALPCPACDKPSAPPSAAVPQPAVARIESLVNADVGIGSVVIRHIGEASCSVLVVWLGPRTASSQVTREMFLIAQNKELGIDLVMTADVKCNGSGSTGAGTQPLQVKVRPKDGVTWGDVVDPSDLVIDGAELFN